MQLWHSPEPASDEYWRFKAKIKKRSTVLFQRILSDHDVEVGDGGGCKSQGARQEHRFASDDHFLSLRVLVSRHYENRLDDCFSGQNERSGCEVRGLYLDTELT